MSISTFNLQQQTLGNAFSTQQRLLETQNQISSGFRTDTFAGLGAGEVEALTSTDDTLSRIGEFLQNNAILSSRTNSQSQAIENVIDITTETRNIIVASRSGTSTDNAGFVRQLESQFQTIAAQLNINLENRFLFGGIRTDQPPVDTSSFPTLSNDEGIPEANYYRGSNQNTLIRAQDGLDIEVQARADDPAIQSIFAALAVAREGLEEDNDDKISQSIDLISQGLEQISLLQVELASINVNLEQSADRLQRQELYLQGVRDSLISTDLLSASTQVAIDQGILQAAFQSFAQINQLSLGDFLR